MGAKQMSRDLDELLDVINKTPNGTKKIHLIEQVIKIADRENALNEQLNLRYELILNSVFYSDCLKAIIGFPRYLSLIDENIEKLDEDHIYYLLWAFKYILNNGFDFYQIKWDNLKDLIDEFKNRCVEYGYSLRYYHQIQTVYYMYFNMVEQATESYNEFKKCKRDNISDCEACELDFNVEYYLFLNELDKAVKVAKPLMDGRKTCGEVPNITYPKLLFYYVKNNMLNEAEKIVEVTYDLIRKNESFLEYLEGVLIYYAIVKPEEGIKVFSKHFMWVLNSRNEKHKLRFYTTSWMLWEKIKQSCERDEFILRLPQNTSFFSDNDIYKVDDIVSYCKRQSMILADNFDKRDGFKFALEYIEEIKGIVFNY